MHQQRWEKWFEPCHIVTFLPSHSCELVYLKHKNKYFTLSLFFVFLFFSQAKYLTKKTQAGSVDAIRLLDELLLQLVVSLKILTQFTLMINVYVMIHNIQESQGRTCDTV